MRQLIAGSLFAGIGGFELGFQRAGIKTRWSVEKNEWCQKVLKKNFPHTQIHGDIFDVGAHNLESVDIICGGFPCQPFSSAGKRGGTEDDRYLWPEMLRVISEIRPAWVVAENVDDLAYGKLATTFEHILSDLEAEGYEVQPFIIPACSLGADHERYRLWILGYTNRHCQPAFAKHDEASRVQAITPTHAKSKRGWQCGWFQQQKGSDNARYIHIWPPEPGLDRVSDGVSRRMDRNRGLGNAIVPQQAELIGRYINQIENQQITTMRQAA